MSKCAELLNLTHKTFKNIVLSTFPSLWAPDMGSSRRLNYDDLEVQAQLQIVKTLRETPGHTKHGDLKIAVNKHNIPKKRYLTLYKYLDGR